MPNKTRKFDGKRYRHTSSHETKTKAKKKAKNLRKSGKNARVVKRDKKGIKRKWMVFRRG